MNAGSGHKVSQAFADARHPGMDRGLFRRQPAAHNEIPTWHFLTGSPEALQDVWRAYGVLASGPPKPDKPGEKQHSPAFFVIDQAGQRRWYFSTNFEGAALPSTLIVKHVRALLAERVRR